MWSTPLPPGPNRVPSRRPRLAIGTGGSVEGVAAYGAAVRSLLSWETVWSSRHTSLTDGRRRASVGANGSWRWIATLEGLGNRSALCRRLRGPDAHHRCGGGRDGRWSQGFATS